MEESDLRDRLIRLETKLDAVLPHIERMEEVVRDISMLKRIMGVAGGLVTLVGTWVATYFGSKH